MIRDVNFRTRIHDPDFFHPGSRIRNNVKSQHLLISDKFFINSFNNFSYLLYFRQNFSQKVNFYKNCEKKNFHSNPNKNYSFTYLRRGGNTVLLHGFL
jgi:hypothetical protein